MLTCKLKSLQGAWEGELERAEDGGGDGGDADGLNGVKGDRGDDAYDRSRPNGDKKRQSTGQIVHVTRE